MNRDDLTTAQRIVADLSKGLDCSGSCSDSTGGNPQCHGPFVDQDKQGTDASDQEALDEIFVRFDGVWTELGRGPNAP